MKTCLYCTRPASEHHSAVTCGSGECRRTHRNARQRSWQRAHVEKNGQWANAKYRERKSNATCVDCDAPVGHGSTQETRCRKCGQRRWAERKAAEDRRKNYRRRAERKLARAAEGVSRGWVFVSGPCHSCGAQFTCQLMNTPAQYCSRTCSRRVAKAIRRALEAGVKVTSGRRHAVFERDGWTCRICGDPVSRDAKVPELDAPTIDHIVPLAQGGAHAPENWQTAHFYCNSNKRDQLGFEFADEEVS